ncbi:hypothetical protein KYC5002_26580 [Archangium violaceum]|uniref:hypothetical protein n=1 Tax=Archangium violaceum TaxID=83451 RepID=UPI002B2B27EC|nr:hypothetical protein KYC5002_26580 [Archangium gephyra]
MTSNANVLRSSFAQSTRCIRSFFDSFLTAASGSTLAPSSPAWGSAYVEVLTELSARREELAARRRSARSDRGAVLEEARTLVLQTLTRRILPAWYRTPWEFYGNTQIPGT